MSSTKPKVLVVLTNTTSYKLNGTEKQTGWYLTEFSHPYEVLKNDVDITVASIKGGKSQMDPGSWEDNKEDKASVNFVESQKALWENTEKLETFIGRAKEFDAIFYVGGLGPMWDLATDETSHKIINEFHSANKIVSAVCHGPAALAFVKTADGSWFLDGQPVTGFSNGEEEIMGQTSSMPFGLEDQLNKASGGHFQKAAEPWAEHVVIGHNGRLITGQNPGSAKLVGVKILEALKA